ncbi:MAG: DJ-1/PfpI family protein [Spirochaetaceae bacterium]|jgi:4-methyl-5(b-hydroxyethyl)-thiazole monophosphate biosynthesis|nr:DJ-1/PfpI family protein [Spirochaetaceae bacterium]
MSKKICVFLAEGFEEVEAITPIDYLRRAEIEVITVSITNSNTVTGSHKIPIITDTLISQIDPGAVDCIILPGGMPGSVNLAASIELDTIIKKFDNEKKLICAICAAPVIVLGPKGILDGRTYTCYPGMEGKISCGEGCAQWSCEKTIADGHIITSRGAGTAGLFSKKIIEKLISKEVAEKIAGAVLL